MAGRETYDISPTQRAILEHRAKRRQVLRDQYLEQIQNPYRHAKGGGGYVDDIAVNRYMAMRGAATDFFKPTWKNTAWMMTFSVIPIGFMIYLAKRLRDAQEKLYRTGQVSYRDRENKFQ